MNADRASGALMTVVSIAVLTAPIWGPKLRALLRDLDAVAAAGGPDAAGIEFWEHADDAMRVVNGPAPTDELARRRGTA